MDPYEELARVKARLKELEALAAQPPRPGIGDALADHFSKPSVDPARRKLENQAHFYAPSEETAFRQRAKDPERYDAAQRAMGGDLLAQSIALAGRAAHVKLGRDLPPDNDPKEGTE